jgi:hypothetical protein
MATAFEIADLLTQGIQGPTGADDSGWHVGTIVTWDTSTGLNSVKILNTTLTNLKALTPSIGTEYAPGQTVLVVRKQTQYFILGPVTVPGSAGSSPPTQVDTGGGNLSGTAGTWRDLDPGASVTPTLSVKLAPSQRCLFMFGAANVRVFGCSVDASLIVTSPGGNNVLANGGALLGQTWTVSNQISLSNHTNAPGFKTFFTKTAPAATSQFTEVVYPGVNSVTMKYRFTVEPGSAGSGTPSATVTNPWIVAIPF